MPIQAVLLGQPQFRKILARPDLDQLRQRITASYHLGPLSSEETRSYVEHRLKLVGWNHDPDFADACFAEIFRYTYGIPRRINTLCSRLMLLGFLEEKHVIADTMVSQVATEMSSELSAGAEKAPVAHKSLNGEARAPESSEPALAQIGKRLTSVEQSVARHDQAIRRALDIIAKYLE